MLLGPVCTPSKPRHPRAPSISQKRPGFKQFETGAPQPSSLFAPWPGSATRRFRIHRLPGRPGYRMRTGHIRTVRPILNMPCPGTIIHHAGRAGHGGGGSRHTGLLVVRRRGRITGTRQRQRANQAKCKVFYCVHNRVLSWLSRGELIRVHRPRNRALRHTTPRGCSKRRAPVDPLTTAYAALQAPAGSSLVISIA